MNKSLINKINNDLINIIRGYLLPTIENIKLLNKDCFIDLHIDLQDIHYSLDHNFCFDDEFEEHYISSFTVENTKIRHIITPYQNYWTVRKL